jgi:hypothetical protein
MEATARGARRDHYVGSFNVFSLQKTIFAIHTDAQSLLNLAILPGSKITNKMHLDLTAAHEQANNLENENHYIRRKLRNPSSFSILFRIAKIYNQL